LRDEASLVAASRLGGPHVGVPVPLGSAQADRPRLRPGGPRNGPGGRSPAWTDEAPAARRYGRLVSRAALVAAGALLATFFVVNVQTIVASGNLFMDFNFYRELGARFLADGTYYLPHQTAGPYAVALMVDVLYPPSALLLFVPAAVAPAALWWAVPLAVTGYCIWHWRPKAAAVAVILLLLAWPRAHAAFLFGNTDMWAMALVAAGLHWGWPAVFLTLKPTLAPFALVGVRHRSFRIAAVAMAGFVALTLPLWLDYVAVLSNLRAPADYSLGSIPLLLVPAAAWVGRQRSIRTRGLVAVGPGVANRRPIPQEERSARCGAEGPVAE